MILHWPRVLASLSLSLSLPVSCCLCGLQAHQGQKKSFRVVLEPSQGNRMQQAFGTSDTWLKPPTSSRDDINSAANPKVYQLWFGIINLKNGTYPFQFTAPPALNLFLKEARAPQRLLTRCHDQAPPVMRRGKLK